jgi:hypothetical protein
LETAMTARSAPADLSNLEIASQRKRPSTDRILRLDAALRDMARTCPLPGKIEVLAERLDRASALRADRRRRGTRKAPAAR